MNIAIVNLIATTPNLSASSVVRGEVPVPASLAQTNIVELAMALAKHGHRTTVVYADRYMRGQALELPGGVRVVPARTVLSFPFYPGLLPLSPGLEDGPILRGADVIQSAEFHQPSTFFASRAAAAWGTPLVVWQEVATRMRRPGSWYQRAYELSAGRHVRRTVRRFIPRTTKARAFLRGLGVPEAAIGPWIPTGIDLDTYRMRRSRLAAESFGWRQDMKVLLIAGRLYRGKAVDVALRALKRVLGTEPTARLLVAGTGPEDESLNRLASELRIAHAVRFLGGMTRDEMVDLYNFADVVLNPSRNDLLPFALIEGGACGRACVATRVGAVDDIVVDGETGFLVGSEDDAALARAVLQLLGDDGLRDAFGREGRKRMERHYGLATTAANLLEVYRDVGG